MLKSGIVREKTLANLEREYNVEKWGTLKASMSNTSFESHQELSKSAHSSNDLRLCALDGRFYQGTAEQISSEYVARIVRELEALYLQEDCDSIVELGAGYGRILVPLVKQLQSKRPRVVALDLAQASLDILAEVFTGSELHVHLDKINLQGRRSDHKALERIKVGRKPLVFTSQAIMYVPVLDDSFIELMKLWSEGVFFSRSPHHTTLGMPNLELRRTNTFD